MAREWQSGAGMTEWRRNDEVAREWQSGAGMTKWRGWEVRDYSPASREAQQIYKNTVVYTFTLGRAFWGYAKLSA